MNPQVSLPSFFAFALLYPASIHALEFEKDIMPILKNKCVKCHSGPKAKKGLEWDNPKVVAEWIKEGKESVIIPGEPTKSQMYIKTKLGRENHPDGMPPLRRGDGPLSEGELAMIGKWIAEGAKIAGEGDEKMTKKVDDKVYEWTNQSGQTIKAGFVRLEGKSVVLKLESGKETTYPMSKLTVESRQQASKLAAGN